MIYKVVRHLFILRKLAEDSQDMQLIEWQSRIVLVIVVGICAMIATVSFEDRIPQYLWVSLVIGICVYRYGMSMVRRNFNGGMDS